MIINIKGYDVIIDDEDFEKVSQYKWHIQKNHIQKDNYNIYVTRSFYDVSSKIIRTIRLHRFIMNCVPNDRKIIDHINGNTLDNRKQNLRFCTNSQNLMNSKTFITNTSGYKGVCWRKSNKKWDSRIFVNGKNIFLGYFDDKELAHQAYCEASARYYGEFSRVS